MRDQIPLSVVVARPRGRLLAMALVGLGSLVTAPGCSSNSSATDLAPVADSSSSPDLGAPVYSYTPATIHQIDTDPGNGPYGNGQRVVLDHVVAVSKVDKYVNSTNQQCRYQIWVQDVTCTTPPCGMVVKDIGPMAPSSTSTGKDCPSAKTSGTLLNTIGRGDNVRIRGHLLFEVDSDPPMGVVEHQLFVESIETLPTDQTVTPLVIADPAVFGQFTTHLGTQWARYEGMYVTIQPTSGVLQVTAFDSSGFHTTPNTTDWGDTFDSDYYPSGATTFPAVGAMYHAISGVVSARHGGAVLPGKNKDFVP